MNEKLNNCLWLVVYISVIGCFLSCIIGLPIALFINQTRIQQGPGWFAACVEKEITNITILEVGIIHEENSVVVSFAQKPDEHFDKSLYVALGQCRQKHLPDTEMIYIFWVKAFPFTALDDNQLHFIAFVFYEAKISADVLDHLLTLETKQEQTDYLVETSDISSYEPGEVNYYIVPEWKYHVSAYIKLLKTDYEQKSTE